MNIIKDIAKSIRDFPTRLRVCFISCRLSIRKFSFSLPISTYFDKNVRFQLRSYKKRIDVGKNVFIGYGSRFALSGGNLLIGENCQLGDHNIYNCFADIKIGKKVLTADNVSFITNRHDYSNPDLAILDQGGGADPIEIGEGTWIGINTVILAGVIIGKHCVIGANSVVNHSIPDYSVAVGAPARVIKKYDFILKKYVKV